MNLADGIILFIIAASALISVRRGFTREAFSLLTWVAAFIVARLFSPALEVLLADSIETPSLRLAVAFGLLFTVTLIVGALINHLLGELIRVTGLSGTDRLLGMVFGALRGALVVVVLVALGHHLFSEDACPVAYTSDSGRSPAVWIVIFTGMFSIFQAATSSTRTCARMHSWIRSMGSSTRNQ